ncbi:NCS2 family permease [Proteiniclasticum sp.]|uniref:NCS2 family permease n=1 Tax=Proteiniclasticum sp. TaxID=2053595 RepID=UPI00289A57A6|nr:NCS2 family permease [Proteiniclasticum sp.]
MEKLFKLKEHGTDVKTEILGGTTTFLTMAYIIFVNPQILALTGMNPGAVFTATIIAAAIGTFIMAFVANVPFAVAPGMGLNAFFTFTVVFILGYTWQQALALVFICGLINVFITVTKIRKMIVKAIPESLQYAISGGIGLFIAYLGIKQAGFLTFTAETASRLTDNGDGSGIFKDIIPALTDFTNPTAQVALIGLLITIVLLLKKVPSAILIGIVSTTIIGIFFGVTHVPELSADMFAIPSLSPTFLKLDFRGIFAVDKLLITLTTVFAFSLTDTFDTIGTFLGAGRKSGIFTEEDANSVEDSKGMNTKMERALFADATATSIGALLGTSNTTTYVESAAGIAQGAKTGLASVTTGVLFLISLFLAPIALMVPGAATAPALIVVGIFMAEGLKNIEWDNLTIAVPAFMVIAFMGFSASITNGIAFGFLFYAIAKIVEGKGKEVHPILYVITVLFILSFILTAVV